MYEITSQWHESMIITHHRFDIGGLIWNLATLYTWSTVYTVCPDFVISQAQTTQQRTNQQNYALSTM